MTAETARKYAWLEQLSTEELEGLLHAQAISADSEDLELTDLILEVMVKRKGDELPDPVKAMEDFNRLYRDLEEPLYPLDDTEEPLAGAGKSAPARPRMVRRVLIAAAVVALMVTMMTVPVLGYDSVFQMIGQWTAEQFGFRAVGTPSDELGRSQPREVPEEYTELQAALSGANSTLMIPSIPDGFEVEDRTIYVSPTTGNITFSILYTNQLNYLTFDIVQGRGENQVSYEKSNEDVKTCIAGDITYYIFPNYDNNLLTWYYDGLEYSLGTTLSTDTLEEILSSIEIFGV